MFRWGSALAMSSVNPSQTGKEIGTHRLTAPVTVKTGY